MKTNKLIYCLLTIFALFLIGCTNKESFGPYGSTHSHADFKVYILGKPLNFNSPQYQVMEELTHIENNDGDILHVHATGLTLGYFLKSLLSFMYSITTSGMRNLIDFPALILFLM